MKDPNPLPAYPQPFFQTERGIAFPWGGYGMGGMSIRQVVALNILKSLIPIYVNTNSESPTNDLLIGWAFKMADDFIVFEQKKQTTP